MVISSSIYDVRYRMEGGLIYGETPFVAGTTTAVNSGNEATMVSVSMAYVDERSYSFNNNSSSGSGGVPTTMQAGVPLIVDNSIQIGPGINISPFEWGKTTTTSRPAQVAGSVPVPPNSVATITYVGTKGKCDVPFSYTQRDVTASGKVVQTQKTDGMFKGSNTYSFKFNVDSVAART